MQEVEVRGIDKVYTKMISKPNVDPIELMFAIAKKSVKIDEPLFTDKYLSKFTREQKVKFLKDVIFGRGHKGILEHVTYTFEIWGVSRSMTHQAVRNRIASFLEGSFRYVDPTEGIFEFIFPMELRGNTELKEELRKEYEEDMKTYVSLYKKWFRIGKEKLNLSVDKCKELARTTLPHSSRTTYTFTMNLASLIMLFNKRACTRAEAEFRSVVEPILEAVRSEMPDFLDNIGPYCEMYGYCPEGKSCCGKAPTLDTLKLAYSKQKLEIKGTFVTEPVITASVIKANE